MYLGKTVGSCIASESNTNIKIYLVIPPEEPCGLFFPEVKDSSEFSVETEDGTIIKKVAYVYAPPENYEDIIDIQEILKEAEEEYY